MCMHMVLEGIANRPNPWNYLQPLQRQSATHCERRFIGAHVVSFVVVLCSVSATIVPCVVVLCIVSATIVPCVIMCMKELCKV